MKLLTLDTAYDKTISLALSINETYDKPVTFHCFWAGPLNEKHLYSILSCYYFNVNQNKHNIVLWLENNVPNEYNKEIEKYAELKSFSFLQEITETGFLTSLFYYNPTLSFYSDVVRYLLLYNYGGIWFDLDCFFLRCFDPLFYHYGKEICVYQWENQNYPNGAIYISLEPKSETMKKNIERIVERKRGWGFQEAQLTYDTSMNVLVLPCSWFDSEWVRPPGSISRNDFFEDSSIVYDFDCFFKGSFCYHWHNNWNKPIEKNSILLQLVNIIKSSIQ
jgi:hypothetical protein